MSLAHSPHPRKSRIDDVLAMLSRVTGPRDTQYGREWKACCPAHDDSTPSLAITEKSNGSVNTHCFAGCSAESIRSALGLPEWMPGGGEVVATYPYRNAEGTYLFEVVRGVDDEGRKQIRNRVVDASRPSGHVWNLQGISSQARTTLYNAVAVKAGIENLQPIYLVEGEKDVDTLASLGVVATTNAGGAGKLTSAHAEQLRGAQVRIIQDNDEAGRRHGSTACALLEEVAETVELFDVPTGMPEKSDVTDMLEAGFDLTDLVRVDPAPAAPGKPGSGAGGADGGSDSDLSPTRSAAARFTDAYFTSRLADALRSSWHYVLGSGWHHWDGRIWAPLTDEALITLETEKFSKKEFAEVTRGGDPEQVRKALNRLGKSAIAAATFLLRGHLAERLEHFDTDPHILVTSDCVVDLRTSKTYPHDPSRLVTKMTPVRFDPSSQHRDWDQVLRAVPPEVADYLQIRFGQAATGLVPDDDRISVLQGGGENGKSTLLNAVMAALGSYSGSLARELFMSKGEVHPTVVMPLRGLRLGVKEEAADGGVLDMLRVKELVGTKVRRARPMYGNYIEFAATDSLFISTNHDLMILEGDDGSWRRFIKIAFPFRYRKPHETLEGPMDRHGDPRLRDRVSSDERVKEAVLAWIVAGAQRWYKADCTMPEPPTSVSDDTRRWREESDPFWSFAADHLVKDPDAVIWGNDLYDQLMTHLIDNGQKRMGVPRFRQRLQDSIWRKSEDARFTGRTRISTLAAQRGRSLILSRPLGAGGLQVPPEQGQYLVGWRFRASAPTAHASQTTTAPIPTPSAKSAEPAEPTAPSEATPALETIPVHGNGAGPTVPRATPEISGPTIAELGGAAA